MVAISFSYLAEFQEPFCQIVEPASLGDGILVTRQPSAVFDKRLRHGSPFGLLTFRLERRSQGTRPFAIEPLAFGGRISLRRRRFHSTNSSSSASEACARGQP